jgi:hypothetical protein
MRCAGFLVLALLLPALAFAEAPPALECRGSAPDLNLTYALTLTGLEGNSVVVEDVLRKETCNCNFRHDNFFDQSKGKIQRLVVRLKHQSCEASCTRDLKKRMNASIDVEHRPRGRSYATPFVGDVIANCDRFSMDLPALRRIEIERIDAMDQTPEFKRRLKDLKGLDEQAPVLEPEK